MPATRAKSGSWSTRTRFAGWSRAWPKGSARARSSWSESSSRVWRSRSLVTAPAAKTGPTSMLNREDITRIPRRQRRLDIQKHGHQRQCQEHAHLDHQPQHQRALAEQFAPHLLVVDRVGPLGQKVGAFRLGQTACRATGRYGSPCRPLHAVPLPRRPLPWRPLPTSGGCINRAAGRASTGPSRHRKTYAGKRDRQHEQSKHGGRLEDRVEEKSRTTPSGRITM